MDSSAFLTEEDVVIQKFKGAPPRGVIRRMKRKKENAEKGDTVSENGATKPVTAGSKPKTRKGGIGSGKSNGTSKRRVTPKKTPIAKKANKTNGKSSNGKTAKKPPMKPSTAKKVNDRGNKVTQLQERMRAMAVKLMNRAKVCPKKHKLKQFTGDDDGYSCNLCSKLCEQVYGCRACDWDACEKCLKARGSKERGGGGSDQGSGSKKTGGKKNKGKKNKKDEKEQSDICWDFVKGTCRKGSRCKWKHEDESLNNETNERGKWRRSISRDRWVTKNIEQPFHHYSMPHNPYQRAYDSPMNPVLMRNSGYCPDEEIFEGLHRRPLTSSSMSHSRQGSVEALMFNSFHLPGPRMDEKMCWNFLEGTCRAGSKCKWSHEFPSDEIDEYVERAVSCPVCSQKFIDYDGLEQHQEAKLHYPPETLRKIKAVMKKKRKRMDESRNRDEDSKDHDWGDWEKHETGFGSKMMKKWGLEDRLGKSKVGPINPVLVDVRRRNTGLGFAGWKKRKRIADDPQLHQILTNGKRRKKNASNKKAERNDSSGQFAQVPLDYSQLQGVEASPSISESEDKCEGTGVKSSVSKAAKKKWINNSKKKKGGKKKKSAEKRLAKGEKGFDICWNFKKGTCRKGDKCKWKHS